jgi:Flp pilus assembly protein TadD
MFCKAIEIDPTHPDFHYNKGVVLTKVGDILGAKRAFDTYRDLLFMA